MKIKKSMNIEFIPSSEEVEFLVPEPKPAKNYIPQWYKEIKGFDHSAPKFDLFGKLEKRTVKECMPFLDTFQVGYIQETWMDIAVTENENGIVTLFNPASPEILRGRETLSAKLTEEFHQYEYVWRMPWIPKTPKGHSVIITHPFNQFLPFISATGIIDSDSFYHSPFGLTPFYVKNNFKGIIPKGTPMYQIIPFKRDAWSMSRIKYDFYNSSKLSHFVNSQYHGVYKNNFWKRKEYN